MVVAIVFLAAAVVAYVVHDSKWFWIIPLCIVLLALLIAALPLKKKITPQEWAAELEPHLLGTEGPFDWDDATGVKLADPRLETLRCKLGKFDLLSTEEQRKRFETVIDALKHGEIPDLSDD